jgi:hypothetical protein
MLVGVTAECMLGVRIAGAVVPDRRRLSGMTIGRAARAIPNTTVWVYASSYPLFRRPGYKRVGGDA